MSEHAIPGPLEITYRDVSALIPYERNPRKNDEAVAVAVASIEAFGFLVPLVIDKDNTIVAGHTRLKAAKQLQLTQVPCVSAEHLTPEQAAAFRVIDNKSHEKATWDYELLQGEFLALDLAQPVFQLAFDAHEFDIILQAAWSPPAFSGDDPQEPDEPHKDGTGIHLTTAQAAVFADALALYRERAGDPAGTAGDCIAAWSTAYLAAG